MNGVSAQDSAAINDLMRGGGFRCEEALNSGESRATGDIGRMVAIRNRCHRDLFTEQVTEHGATIDPFVDEIVPTQMRHSLGVGAGMTSDDVATAAEITDLALVHESGPPDPG